MNAGRARDASARRWRRWAPRALAFARMILLASLAASAQAISYTVQVVAVSDENRARALEEQLLASGFAAYTLTVPTQQGLIYRLRIGAFADRDSAERFADALSPPGGDPATPALAESIPEDLIPLEPAWLGRYAPGSDLRVLPSPAGPLLRARAKGALEPSYRLPDGRRVSAFRLMPQPDGGWLVVRALLLWPADWQGLSEEARAQQRQTVLGNVASALGRSAGELEPYVFAPAGQAPFLAVVERWSAGGGDRERLPALGDPARGIGADGPELHWFGGSEVEIREPEPLWTLPEAPAPVASVTGERWQAQGDGGFVRLELGERSWRVVPGAPLWAAGDLLAVWDEGAVVLYALLEPTL